MSTRFLSVPHVAEVLDCSRGHVYDLIAKGYLKTVDIGLGTRPKTRITAESLDTYITSLQAAAAS